MRLPSHYRLQMPLLILQLTYFIGPARIVIQLSNQVLIQILTMTTSQIKAIILKHETGWAFGEEFPEKFLRPYFPVKKSHRHYESSGVTIGPGISLRTRNSREIRKMFKQILASTQLKLIEQAGRLKGKDAQEWVDKNREEIKINLENFLKLFDDHFEILQKTMNSIFSCAAFKEKYKIDGLELLANMKAQYRIAMYDLLFIGRNNVTTREALIPVLIKIHQSTATEVQIVKLNNEIIRLYNGLKNRQNSIKQILNGVLPITENSLLLMNKKMKKIVQNSTSDQLGAMLQENGNGEIEYNNHPLNLSEIKIDGFSLTDDLIKMHMADGECPYLRDLIVPLKVFYDDQIEFKNLSISIDPQDPLNPDGPFYEKVYYPKQMEGTYYAQMMMQADYIMKQLGLGVDEKGEPFVYPESLKKIGLDFESLIKFINVRKQRRRKWIVIKKVHFLQNDKKGIRIGDLQMGIQARVQQIGAAGSLVDAEVELSQRAKRFCQLFTQHYNVLEQEYEVFKIIKRLAKASVIAKLMKKRGCKINLKLINELFERQKTDKSSKIIPRLFNEKQFSKEELPLLQHKQKVSKIQFSFAGGCDLAFHEEMGTVQSETGCISQDQEQDSNYIPFLFQSYIECEEDSCENICNSKPQFITDVKCEDHTSKICNICWKPLRKGVTYKVLGDGRAVHAECLHCEACYGYMTDDRVQIQNLFYHKNCAPLVSIGNCYVCGSDIDRNEAYLYNSKGMLHNHCEQKFSCQICKQKSSKNLLIKIKDVYYHDTCVKCFYCREVIIKDVTVIQQGFSHSQCVPKNYCDICKLVIEGDRLTIEDKSYHNACLVCFKCGGELEEEFSIDQEGHFYHEKCCT